MRVFISNVVRNNFNGFKLINIMISTVISRTSQLAVAVVFGLVLGIGIQSVLAWTSPSGAPPSGNVTPPVTTGSSFQTKTGPFAVNTSGAGGTGMIVANGRLTVGMLNSPSATQSQLLTYINGKVGATQYCDEDGLNCTDIASISTPPTCTGAKFLQWSGSAWLCTTPSGAGGPPPSGASYVTGLKNYEGSTNATIQSTATCPVGSSIINCERKIYLVGGYCPEVPVTGWTTSWGSGYSTAVATGCYGSGTYSVSTTKIGNTCVASIVNPKNILTWDGIQARATCN